VKVYQLSKKKKKTPSALYIYINNSLGNVVVLLWKIIATWQQKIGNF
jgi:hypothetical protein